jgi:prephenate dehydrogenase
MTSGIGSVGIAGLGLIGGSMARDLLARRIRVKGFDRNAARLRETPSADLLRITFTSSLSELANADVVVIAVPVASALDLLAGIAPHLGHARLVIDVGSTKRSIVSAAERLGIGERFVGCHPMAGDHRFGWEATRYGLFADAPVYLCPTPSTSEDSMALATEFWRGLGSTPCVMDAAAHDERLAYTSHLPHAIATALALALESVHVPRAELGPGGREMTRVSGSSPEMWEQIMLDNAGCVLPAIETMEAQLRDLRSRIRSDNVDSVHRWFTAGHDWFARSEPSNGRS